MNRILGLFAAAGVLLSACGGGGIQSPDFTPVLQGISITYSGKTASSTAVVAPGATFQFSAVGLYSTPPGTASSSNTVICPTSSNTIGVCTLGQISGVSWSVDPSSGNTGAIASVDNSGKATGLRRGTAGIRAKASGFETTERLVVSGAVLRSLAISATATGKGSAEISSVPTGRSFTLKATPQCENESRTSINSQNCVAGKVYNYSWSLPATVPADTVEFTNGNTGESIVVRTKKFGTFSVDVVATNEEGDRVAGNKPLSTTVRVLDDIIVSSDPEQAEPVSVVLRAQTRFVAKGIFSTGEIDDIKASDLGGSGHLTWTSDASAVGQFDIDQSAPAPTAAVLATGRVVGSSGITASGSNIEATPLVVDDRAAVLVKNLGLLRLTGICPAALPISTACPVNVQISNGSFVDFSTRGLFQDGTTTIERVIDPAQLTLTYGKTVNGTTDGDVTVSTAVSGRYTGTKQGPVTLTVTLADPLAEPQVMGTNRIASTRALVVDALCIDQLLISNGASSSSEVDSSGASEVTNTGNVIDNDFATFGTFTIGSELMEGSLSMIFTRPTVTITPPAAGQPVGVLLQYNENEFDAEDLAEIQTLNAAGQVVQTLNISVSDVQRGGVAYKLATANATLPFTSVRINVVVPSVLALTPVSGGSLDPSLIATLLSLLGSGGSVEVNAFAACGQSR